jgi:hypothetical protein
MSPCRSSRGLVVRPNGWAGRTVLRSTAHAAGHRDIVPTGEVAWAQMAPVADRVD